MDRFHTCIGLSYPLFASVLWPPSRQSLSLGEANRRLTSPLRKLVRDQACPCRVGASSLCRWLNLSPHRPPCRHASQHEEDTGPALSTKPCPKLKTADLSHCRGASKAVCLGNSAGDVVGKCTRAYGSGSRGLGAEVQRTVEGGSFPSGSCREVPAEAAQARPRPSHAGWLIQTIEGCPASS